MTAHPIRTEPQTSPYLGSKKKAVASYWLTSELSFPPGDNLLDRTGVESVACKVSHDIRQSRNRIQGRGYSDKLL